MADLGADRLGFVHEQRGVSGGDKATSVARRMGGTLRILVLPDAFPIRARVRSLCERAEGLVRRGHALPLATQPGTGSALASKAEGELL